VTLTTTRMTASPSDAPARADSSDLDGYRGIAALGIVIFHAYQFSRGDATSSYPYGTSVAEHILRNLDGLVSMFFVLSAYLLYLPLARSLVDGASSGSARAFLLRRAARILPLYWAGILIVWCVRNPTLPGDWRDLVEHMTFTQVFDSKRIFYTIGPAWSLSVEAFFYAFLAVLIPVFAFAARRITGRAWRTATVLGPPVILAIGSGAYQLWALQSHQSPTRWAVWFNPLARADMFAAGMLLAVTRALWSGTLRTPALVTLRLSALALLAYGCAIRTDEAGPTTRFNALSVVAFTLLVGSSVFAPAASHWRRLLGNRNLLWLGLVSYSLYLWHEPVLLYLDGTLHLNHAPHFFPVNALALLAVSVPAAWLSYVVIERPMGRLRTLLDRHGVRRDYYPDADSPHN
jgi:peptidoglycan/LPS O-acetylase OafA/YrhL